MSAILACGLTLAALSLNLSFLLAVILCIIFFFVSFRNINQDTLWALIKAVLCAFLLSAFYTIPMLEQLLSQLSCHAAVSVF